MRLASVSDSVFMRVNHHLLLPFHDYPLHSGVFPIQKKNLPDMGRFIIHCFEVGFYSVRIRFSRFIVGDGRLMVGLLCIRIFSFLLHSLEAHHCNRQ